MFEHFKEKHPDFDYRKEESTKIMNKYTGRKPIVVEPHCKSVSTPIIDKNKFLVDDDMSMGKFAFVIRKRLKLNSAQSLFLFVDNSVLPVSDIVKNVYSKYKDEDGFLYIHYSLENTFG